MKSVAAYAASLVLLLVCAPAGAGPDETGLDELLARMAATRGVETEFHERREVALLVEPLESRGLLYFVPPDRMARFTIEPAFSALVADGGNLSFRDAPEGEEMDLSGSPMAAAFVENFTAVFSGDRRRLERFYETRLETRGEDWELILVPRGLPLSHFIEAVTLRGDAGGMRELDVRETDGDQTLTRFVSVELDRSFDSDELETLFQEREPLAKVR